MSDGQAVTAQPPVSGADAAARPGPSARPGGVAGLGGPSGPDDRGAAGGSGTGGVAGFVGSVGGGASGTQGAGGAAGRRRHRRVVALSSVDRDRVARGLPTLEEAEALRRQRTDALTQALARPDGGGEHANDARLLANVPPHWGNGR